MDPYERSRIVTILYNEVTRATQIAQETKHTDPKAHRAAQEALERAIQRYTNFTLDGHIPEELCAAAATISASSRSGRLIY